MSACKLLDKSSAKQLIDSLDTVLTDCDGMTFLFLLSYCQQLSDKHQPV